MASAIALVGEAITSVVSSDAAFRVGSDEAFRVDVFFVVPFAVFFAPTVFTVRDVAFFAAVFLVTFLDAVFTVL